MGVILKKIFIFFLVFSLFNIFLNAVEISSQTANAVALFHWSVFGGGNGKLVTVDPIKSKEGKTLAYVAGFSPTGFVVIAPDTDLYPIIAYSFKEKFSFNGIPQNALLQMVKKDVQNMLSHKGNLNTIKNNEVWTKYQNKDKNYFTSNKLKQWPPKGATNTDGWLTTLWTETNPYNKKCPKDPNTGIRTFAGSVSVALAQIFNYFHFLPPLSFNSSDSYQTLNGINIDADSKKYDFPSFSDLNNNLSKIRQKLLSNASISKTEAAYLIFACAISVNMHFSSETADSWTWDVLNATKNKFKYNSAKMYYPDDDSFFIHLKKNLKNKLPVAIDFNDINEHLLACDGMNNSGFYHLNIGWNEKSQNSMTAWYHINKDNLNIVSQAIMYFKKSYSLPSNIKKIELPSDIVNETLTDEDTPTTEKKSKKDLKKDILETTIEEQIINKPQKIKQTSYEEPPVPIKQVPPHYPRLVKKAGIEGTVVLSVEIKKDGTVGDVEVVKSVYPGKGGLDEAAIKAVKKWKFEPAKSAGEPITVWVNIPLTFSLH